MQLLLHGSCSCTKQLQGSAACTGIDTCAAHTHTPAHVQECWASLLQACSQCLSKVHTQRSCAALSVGLPIHRHAFSMSRTSPHNCAKTRHLLLSTHSSQYSTRNESSAACPKHCTTKVPGAKRAALLLQRRSCPKQLSALAAHCSCPKLMA